MKVKNYMDCFFDECKDTDLINDLIKRINVNKIESFIVVDKFGGYKGILRTIDLYLHNISAGSARDYMIKMVPVKENTDIRKIKEYKQEILPITNNENYPVGIIKLSNVLPIFSRINDVENTGKKYFKKYLQSKYTIENIIGNSASTLKLKESIIKAARIKSTVLLLGETGVGKELVAQSIASLSERRFNPFVRINCAAIPDNLLESELFGYEEGSYTGASKGGSIGKFEIADGGTIFLDEIGDMKMMMQAKILRVLQEKEIERVGGRYPIPVDVRVIAATHANLDEMVENGTFRKDLFYRLNVIPIKIPPLRDHIEDIEVLMNYFAKKYEEDSISNHTIEDDVYDLLKKYDWPGNIRELRNTIEMLVGMTNGVINTESARKLLGEKICNSLEDSVLKSNTDVAEKETIIKYLKINNGNKIKVAETLGISRSSLYNKLRKYEIK